VRERILEAAFAAFMKSGYAAASKLEIATRARVSKRELYKLVGNKQEMLIACISERAKRFDVPADLPVLSDRETLAQVLASFGSRNNIAVLGRTFPIPPYTRLFPAFHPKSLGLPVIL
jgi:AcrR family transcriptional regulator